ncbi:hypothetical protein MP228_012292 [Amoeboaphelidium protococcarum]|nr:hypothetical protein MP228_012292 [Amoeboaphelidium protococcarum]
MISQGEVMINYDRYIDALNNGTFYYDEQLISELVSDVVGCMLDERLQFDTQSLYQLCDKLVSQTFGQEGQTHLKNRHKFLFYLNCFLIKDDRFHVLITSDFVFKLYRLFVDNTHLVVQISKLLINLLSSKPELTSNCIDLSRDVLAEFEHMSRQYFKGKISVKVDYLELASKASILNQILTCCYNADQKSVIAMLKDEEDDILRHLLVYYQDFLYPSFTSQVETDDGGNVVGMDDTDANVIHKCKSKFIRLVQSIIKWQLAADDALITSTLQLLHSYYSISDDHKSSGRIMKYMINANVLLDLNHISPSIDQLLQAEIEAGNQNALDIVEFVNKHAGDVTLHDSVVNGSSSDGLVITRQNSPMQMTQSQYSVSDPQYVDRTLKISQVMDLFPMYGEGFLEACLIHFNDSVEETISQLCEYDRLPEVLKRLDLNMPRKFVSSHSVQQQQTPDGFPLANNNNNNNKDQDGVSQLRQMLEQRLKVDDNLVQIQDKVEPVDQVLDGKKFEVGDYAKYKQFILDAQYEDEVDEDDLVNLQLYQPKESNGEDSVDEIEGDDIDRQQVQVGEIDDKSTSFISVNTLLDDVNFRLLLDVYVNNPQLLSRNDAEIRKSKERAQLRQDTKLSDEQLEGWKIMFDRHPKKQQLLDQMRHRIEDVEMSERSQKDATGSFNRQDQRSSARRFNNSRGRGGRGRGRYRKQALGKKMKVYQNDT